MLSTRPSWPVSPIALAAKSSLAKADCHSLTEPVDGLTGCNSMRGSVDVSFESEVSTTTGVGLAFKPRAFRTFT